MASPYADILPSLTAARRKRVAIVVTFMFLVLALMAARTVFESAQHRLQAEVANESAHLRIAEQMALTLKYADLTVHRMLPAWNSSAYDESLAELRQYAAAQVAYLKALESGGEVADVATLVPSGFGTASASPSRYRPGDGPDAERERSLDAARRMAAATASVAEEAVQLADRLRARDACFRDDAPCLSGAIVGIRAIGNPLGTRLDREHAPAAENRARVAASLESLRQSAEGQSRLLDTIHLVIEIAIVVFSLLIVWSTLAGLRMSEAALAAAKREADAASEMKSRFVATISHEIRTPLNAILGSSTLLLDAPLDKEGLVHARNIEASGRALLELVNGILDISKIEAGGTVLDVSPFRVDALLDSVLAITRPAAVSKGLKVVAQVPTELGAMLGDEGQIRRVLINLAGNAVKFTASGRVTLRCSRAPDGLRFEVEDTGVGIPQEARWKLFNPFSQVDSSDRRRYGGTGLGLYLCRQLVEHMGGRIGVESELGHGSVFWFELPLKDAPAGASAPARASGRPDASKSATGPRKVLLVEDTLSNQIVAKAFLKRLNCDVDVASSGEEGLSAVAASAYDLIFMDLQMPGMDGIETTERIRRLNLPRPTPPVVALTANATTADRERCVKAGMVDFVAKPVTLQALDDCLSHWLGSRVGAGGTGAA